MKALFLLLFSAILWAPLNAKAQQDPVEITAGQTLEWHRGDKQFIARGDVIAKQQTMTVYGDTLTADYREEDGSSMAIYQMTATGNVRLDNNDGSVAHGDKAVYLVDEAKVTLTGGDLKLVSPGRTITASDRMEYYTTRGEAAAIGNAKLVQGDDIITASTLKAYFKENPQGGRALSHAEAISNVVITMPEEKITGNYGTYTAANNMAEIKENVVITHGQNVLEGARAEVDLTTNISKMFGGKTSPTGDSRVRGVFYPGSEPPPTAGAQ